MPLCDMCRSEADWTMGKREHVGKRIETEPPHGMEWGQECDRCGVEAR